MGFNTVPVASTVFAGTSSADLLHRIWGPSWRGILIERLDAGMYGTGGADACRCYFIIIPHFALLVFGFVLPVVSHYLPEPSAKKGTCDVCHYDIRACVGRCSECGTPLDQDRPDGRNRIFTFRRAKIPIFVICAFYVFLGASIVRLVDPSRSYFRYAAAEITDPYYPNSYGYICPGPFPPQELDNIANIALLESTPLNVPWVDFSNPGIGDWLLMIACTAVDCLIWGRVISCGWRITQLTADRIRGSEN
jgi:hypothetical protein